MAATTEVFNLLQFVRQLFLVQVLPIMAWLLLVEHTHLNGAWVAQTCLLCSWAIFAARFLFCSSNVWTLSSSSWVSLCLTMVQSSGVVGLHPSARKGDVSDGPGTDVGVNSRFFDELLWGCKLSCGGSASWDARLRSISVSSGLSSSSTVPLFHVNCRVAVSATPKSTRDPICTMRTVAISFSIMCFGAIFSCPLKHIIGMQLFHSFCWHFWHSRSFVIWLKGSCLEFPMWPQEAQEQGMFRLVQMGTCRRSILSNLEKYFLYVLFRFYLRKERSGFVWTQTIFSKRCTET